ncbi:MAG: hypothetical protein LBJ83_00180 [Oscillospiraceae bacterium]|jgi:hypothetical protein|nr:hypothetical protein [Oscillospiraceae bacterium]
MSKRRKKAVYVSMITAIVVIAGSLFFVFRNPPGLMRVAAVKQTVSLMVDEMMQQVIGELKLSNEKREAVAVVVEAIVKLKNKQNLSKLEKRELNKCNKKLSNILNQYTKDQFLQNPMEDIELIADTWKTYINAQVDVNSEWEEDAQYKINANLTLERGEDLPAVAEKIGIIKPVESVLISPEEKERKQETVWEQTKKILPSRVLQCIDYFSPFYYVLLPQGNGFAPAFCGSFKVTTEVTTEVTTNENEVAYSVLGVDISVLEEESLAMFAYQLCHEFGHFISLYSEPEPSENSAAMVIDVPPYVAIRFRENSYMKAFVDRFYKYTLDDKHNDENGYLFYLRHRKDFVSLYASTHIFDDFAESFASFITEEELKENRGREKVEFFEGYPEFVTLKDEIQVWYKLHGISPSRSMGSSEIGTM